jgi:hypothetical protein
MVHMLALGLVLTMKELTQMDKYIYGFDILQEMDIAIPVIGSIIYTNLENANKTIPETVKQNVAIINDVISWMDKNNSPTEMRDFIASFLGSKVDKMWDFNKAEVVVNNNGVIYTLKNVKIIDFCELEKMINKK